MDKTCELCGAAFVARPYSVRAGYGRYCSRKCYGISQRTQVERTCATCGNVFNAIPAAVATGAARFCSRTCFDISRRGQRKPVVAYRMMRAKGHPVAPPSGIAPIARVMLYDAIGPGPHPCHWCGSYVAWDRGGLVVDHLDHDPTNDVIENLVPSCNPCNAHRRRNGGSPIIQEGELVKVKPDGTRSRAIERRCEFCGGPFPAALSQVRLGKGRFCSRACARSGPRGRKN